MITNRLTYTVEDYEKGKKWALSQPHPFIKNKNLWEYVYDVRESTYTISNLNNYLFNET